MRGAEKKKKKREGKNRHMTKRDVNPKNQFIFFPESLVGVHDLNAFLIISDLVSKYDETHKLFYFFFIFAHAQKVRRAVTLFFCFFFFFSKKKNDFPRSSHFSKEINSLLFKIRH